VTLASLSRWTEVRAEHREVPRGALWATEDEGGSRANAN
jgi:hypothetical protein